MTAELEWKVVYVGCASDKSYDQILEEFTIKGISVGMNDFIMQAPAPNYDRIPNNELLGVSAVLLMCSYLGQKFVNVGYFINNEYSDSFDSETYPARVDISKLYRKILADQPRLTKFDIDWEGGSSALTRRNGLRGVEEMVMGENAAVDNEEDVDRYIYESEEEDDVVKLPNLPWDSLDEIGYCLEYCTDDEEDDDWEIKRGNEIVQVKKLYGGDRHGVNPAALIKEAISKAPHAVRIKYLFTIPAKSTKIVKYHKILCICKKAVTFNFEGANIFDKYFALAPYDKINSVLVIGQHIDQQDKEERNVGKGSMVFKTEDIEGYFSFCEGKGIFRRSVKPSSSKLIYFFNEDFTEISSVPKREPRTGTLLARSLDEVVYVTAAPNVKTNPNGCSSNRLGTNF